MRVEYDSYKESGVPWAGDIPLKWETYPFFALAKANETKNSGLKEQNLLSLSYGRIIEKDINTKFGLLPESFETYQIVEPGQIVFRLTDLQNDKVSLRSALVKDRGIITSAYLAVGFEKLVPSFADYLMRAYDKQMVFYELGGGVRQSAKYDDLKWMPVIVPPEDEQKAIASFLDEKTTQIDQLIEKTEKLLELLAEKRTALITQAVTKGLDPTALMKPSGVVWFDTLPKHWEVRRLKDVGSLTGGAGFPHDFQNVEGEELFFYKVGDLGKSSDGVHLTKSPHTISRETAKKLGASIIPPNTIVYAKIGAALLLNRRRMTTSSCCIDNNMTAWIVDQSKVFPFWGLYWMSTVDFGEHTNPGAVPSLSEGYQSVLPIAVPPLDEQIKIIDHIQTSTSRIDEITGKITSAILKLKEYRSALITNAVTGKIKVT